MFFILASNLLLLLVFDIVVEVESLKGGQALTVADGPFYSASIQYGGKHICSGVVVTDELVMTSGTCMQCFNDRPYREDGLTIYLGTYDATKSKYVHHVKRRYCFGKYKMLDNNIADNDVALLKLTKLIHANIIQMVGLSTFVKPPKEGAKCILYGWHNSRLYGVEPVILDNAKKCATELKIPLPSSILCTTATEFSTAPSDMGAPLICNGKLAGLYMWKNPKAPPAIFVDVSHYLQFVSNVALEGRI